MEEPTFLSLDFNDLTQLRIAVQESRMYSIHELVQLYKLADKDLKAVIKGVGSFYVGERVILGEQMTSNEKSKLLQIIGTTKDKLKYLIRLRVKIKREQVVKQYIYGTSHLVERVYVQYPLNYKWNVEVKLCMN